MAVKIDVDHCNEREENMQILYFGESYELNEKIQFLSYKLKFNQRYPFRIRILHQKSMTKAVSIQVQCMTVMPWLIQAGQSHLEQLR